MTAAFPASGQLRPQIALLPLFLIGLCALALYFGWFHRVDRFLYDALLPLGAPEVDERLLIVGIDERTLDVVGRWPWQREDQARLIAQITAAAPAALVVDVVYSSESDPVNDAALMDALNTPVITALPMIIDSVALNQPLIEVLPFSQLLPLIDVLGHVHVELDDDSIARSTYLYQGVGNAHWPHLMLTLAQELGWVAVNAKPDCTAETEFTLQNQRCAKVLIPFAGPPGTIREVSALDILEGRIDPELFKDRVLFIGLTASGVADSVTSPVSGDSRPMSGVEFNANLFNAILAERMVVPASPGLIWFFTLLNVGIIGLLLPHTTPKSMLVVSIAGAVVPLIITALSTLYFSRYLPLGVASVASLLAYPFWSWRRHEAAWRYLDNEMTRLELERERYEPVEAALVASRTVDPQRLATLLDAQYAVDAPVGNSLPSVYGPALIAWSDVAGVRHRLTRESEFTIDEQQLIGELVAAEPLSASVAEPIPGESLAAKIRLLRQQALAVQLGRDIGLQGLERMASGVCVISAVGDLLFANTAVQRFLGANMQPGQDIFELVRKIPPPLGQSWSDIWRSVVTGQQPLRFETPLDEATQVFIYCAPLTGDAQGAWLLTITDTTEVRVAQRRREEALAFLSHDLRSPILSVIALARKPLSTLDDGGDLLQQIEDYAQKSLAVSEQFLQLSRLEAQTHFEAYELDLVAVLINAVDQSFAAAKAGDIIFDTNALTPLDEGVWMRGNGELLERAFGNLFANAIKYSNAGSRVTVTVHLTSDFVEVDIADQGLGIPAADLPHLFDSYYRSAEPELAQRRGSGLGLRFVKTVVERHSGEVAVRSEQGAGSTFTVKLPLLPAAGGLEDVA